MEVKVRVPMKPKILQKSLQEYYNERMEETAKK